MAYLHEAQRRGLGRWARAGTPGRRVASHKFKAATGLSLPPRVGKMAITCQLRVVPRMAGSPGAGSRGGWSAASTPRAEGPAIL